MNRRYQNTFVRPESTPVIDGQTRWKPEREPIHVAATAGEIVTIGLSIGGVALAAFLMLDYVNRALTNGAPLSLWSTAAYVVPAAVLIAIGLWALYHYRRNEKRLDRDDYAWMTMQAKLADRDRQIAARDLEIVRLNKTIDDRDSLIRAISATSTRYVAPHAEPDQPVRDAASAAAEAASNSTKRFNSAVRFIVSRWENNNPEGYTREACVAAGTMTGNEWTAAMDAIEAAGFVRRQGKGNGRVIVALRAQDILDKMLR